MSRFLYLVFLVIGFSCQSDITPKNKINTNDELNSLGIIEGFYIKSDETLKSQNSEGILSESSMELLTPSDTLSTVNWYFLPIDNTSNYLQNNQFDGSNDSPWDIAYQMEKAPGILKVEPKFKDSYMINELGGLQESSCPPLPDSLLNRWPPSGLSNKFFNWHLGDEYSQLRTAARKVYNGTNIYEDTIIIAHLDTGYDPNHDGIPDNLIAEANLMKNEDSRKAIDKEAKRFKKINYGHGLGTLGLLAGGEIIRPDGEKDTLGGNPFAKVVTIRMSNGSPLFYSNNLTRAIYLAINKYNCDVISLSLGGVPFALQTDAVKYAYKKGVPIVAAAGNNYTGSGKPAFSKKIFLGKSIIWPARYDQVIAATAVTHDKLPNAFKFYPLRKDKVDSDCHTEHMQISYKPKNARDNLVAAFAPNLTWAKIGSQNQYRYSGGGTSGATPQIAAGVSLWLQKHKKTLLKKGYEGWEIIETLRYVLHTTAEMPSKRDCRRCHKFIGRNGVLKAEKLIDFPPEEFPDKSTLIRKSSKAIFPLLRIILRSPAILGGDPKFESIRFNQNYYTELWQIASIDVEVMEQIINLYDEYDKDDYSEEKITELQKPLVENLVGSEYISNEFRDYLNSLVFKREE